MTDHSQPQKQPHPSNKLQLVLGGARSGKSTYAENILLNIQVQSNTSENHKPLFYIATAEPLDDEMTARIEHHQSTRQAHSSQGQTWQTIETPITLADTIKGLPRDSLILVDCLTLWLSNCMHQSCWPEEKSALLTHLTSCDQTIVFVSNEVSWGVVPIEAQTRWYVDELGRLHQELAALCDTVTLVVAGIPLQLKPSNMAQQESQ